MLLFKGGSSNEQHSVFGIKGGLKASVLRMFKSMELIDKYDKLSLNRFLVPSTELINVFMPCGRVMPRDAIDSGVASIVIASPNSSRKSLLQAICPDKYIAIPNWLIAVLPTPARASRIGFLPFSKPRYVKLCVLLLRDPNGNRAKVVINRSVVNFIS